MVQQSRPGCARSTAWLLHASLCTAPRRPRANAHPQLPALPAGLHGSILRAGALWLLGVCGAELRTEHWGQAFGLVVAHVTHGDVVVSLPWL